LAKWCHFEKTRPKGLCAATTYIKPHQINEFSLGFVIL
jgi:hypothetical protein